MTGSSAAALLLVLLSVGCAAKAHKALVTFNAAALASVQTIASTERQLSAAGLLSLPSALALRQKLAPVITLGQSSTKALILWQSGQPIPPDLLKLSDAMGKLLTDVVNILPDGEARSKLLTVIAVAQQAWQAVLVVMVR